MSVAGELARWGARLDLADVPDPVRAAATRHLLDGLGTALAAHRLGAASPAVLVARGLGGPPEATVLGSGERLSAPAAAFANGVLVHALDFDDTHAGGLVHATSVVLPAALAIGQQTGAPGALVLAACVVGYETGCRVAMAAPHGFHARGLHATQVAGVFAAAAATARLLGLDPATTTHALGIAGSGAGGLLEFLSTGASTKQLHPGSAALSGILAARLAAHGATGPATVLEGPHGVYAALAARPARPEQVTVALGDTWETTRITIKPYPSCQLMHAALDAAAGIDARPPSTADIDRITVEVHPDCARIVCEPATTKPRPRTPYDAKFSLPWSLAALLIDGRLDLDSYTAASIRRPDIAALAGKVHTRTVAGTGPAADAPSSVRIHLRDGRTRSGSVPHSHGTPQNPLSQDALRAKFLGNVGTLETAAELAERVTHLADEPDLSRITELTTLVGKD